MCFATCFSCFGEANEKKKKKRWEGPTPLEKKKKKNLSFLLFCVAYADFLSVPSIRKREKNI